VAGEGLIMFHVYLNRLFFGSEVTVIPLNHRDGVLVVPTDEQIRRCRRSEFQHVDDRSLDEVHVTCPARTLHVDHAKRRGGDYREWDTVTFSMMNGDAEEVSSLAPVQGEIRLYMPRFVREQDVAVARLGSMTRWAVRCM
jgi:hypothetical protein